MKTWLNQVDSLSSPLETPTRWTQVFFFPILFPLPHDHENFLSHKYPSSLSNILNYTCTYSFFLLFIIPPFPFALEHHWTQYFLLPDLIRHLCSNFLIYVFPTYVFTMDRHFFCSTSLLPILSLVSHDSHWPIGMIVWFGKCVAQPSVTSRSIDPIATELIKNEEASRNVLWQDLNSIKFPADLQAVYRKLGLRITKFGCTKDRSVQSCTTAEDESPFQEHLTKPSSCAMLRTSPQLPRLNDRCQTLTDASPEITYTCLFTKSRRINENAVTAKPETSIRDLPKSIWDNLEPSQNPNSNMELAPNIPYLLERPEKENNEGDNDQADLISKSSSMSDKDLVYTAYKRVDKKIKPVPTSFPEDCYVERRIPEDPLLTLPLLSCHPPSFELTQKFQKSEWRY